MTPPFELVKTKNVIFKGLEFQSISDEGGAVVLDICSSAQLDYCSAKYGKAGVVVMNQSHLSLNNCYIYENRAGVAAVYKSLVNVVGANYFKDNTRIGLAGFQGGTLVFQSWQTNPLRFVTDIRTTVPMLKYVALWLTKASNADIEDAWFDDDDIDVSRAIVEYFGHNASKHFDSRYKAGKKNAGEECRPECDCGHAGEGA